MATGGNTCSARNSNPGLKFVGQRREVGLEGEAGGAKGKRVAPGVPLHGFGMWRSDITSSVRQAFGRRGADDINASKLP